MDEDKRATWITAFEKRMKERVKMSEPERLEIPTPWGKRLVWCQCNDSWGRPGQGTLCCLGCDYAGRKVSDDCIKPSNAGECPTNTYGEDRCPECAMFMWVYLNKDDEPKGA